MKRYTTRPLIGLLIALLLAATAPLLAAPAGLLSSTTLSASITSTQTTLVLASASASTGSTYGAPAAGQCLYIDLEMMRIQAMSSTTATVQRGTRNRSAHASSAVILTGPCSTGLGGFMAADPPTLVGNQDCTAVVLPWVNQVSGDSWWCDQSANSWSVTNPVQRNGTAGSRRVAQ